MSDAVAGDSSRDVPGDSARDFSHDFSRYPGRWWHRLADGRIVPATEPVIVPGNPPLCEGGFKVESPSFGTHVYEHEFDGHSVTICSSGLRTANSGLYWIDGVPRTLAPREVAAAKDDFGAQSGQLDGDLLTDAGFAEYQDRHVGRRDVARDFDDPQHLGV